MSCLHPADIRFDKLRLVVFDLDGTIADTSEGIINSHRQAHIVMGREVPSDDILYSLIGGPLLETYKKVFHFSDTDAAMAVNIYREWYSQNGIHQAALYPGIPDLLRRLKESKICVGMATLKAERFAVSMMSELGVGSLFDFIYGMNDKDTLSKADLIAKCMDTARVSQKETCMIGDSIHDFNGARVCQVPFIAVSYGFGFKKGETQPFPVCDTAADIGMILGLV